jgi:hypothetical protein
MVHLSLMEFEFNSRTLQIGQSLYILVPKEAKREAKLKRGDYVRASFTVVENPNKIEKFKVKNVKPIRNKKA